MAYKKNFDLCSLPRCNNGIHYSCYCRSYTIHCTKKYFWRFYITTVQTYSKLWGRKKAVVVLSLLFVIEYLLVILGLTHTYKEYFFFGGLTLLVILIVSIYFMIKFLKKDLSGKIVEAVSGLWIIFSSMCMGFLPYFVFSLIK